MPEKPGSTDGGHTQQPTAVAGSQHRIGGGDVQKLEGLPQGKAQKLAGDVRLILENPDMRALVPAVPADLEHLARTPMGRSEKSLLYLVLSGPSSVIRDETEVIRALLDGLFAEKPLTVRQIAAGSGMDKLNALLPRQQEQELLQTGIANAPENTGTVIIAPEALAAVTPHVHAVHAEVPGTTAVIDIKEDNTGTVTIGTEKYVVEKLVGSGGLAKVYKVRGEKPPHIFAFKLLKNLADPARHRREVEILKYLDDVPQVPTLHEHGEAGGVAGKEAFMLEEFVQGMELTDFLKGRGRMPLQEVSIFAGKVAQGLEYVHAKGIIHRDLKPGNIMICRDLSAKNGAITHADEFKIIDFNLARQEQVEYGVTPPAAILGTMLYMPREQMKGNQTDVTPRADVYALGLILIQMLTGQPPVWKADFPIEVLIAKERGELPINTEFRAFLELPDDVRVFLLRMIAQYADERPTMAEVKTFFNSLFGDNNTAFGEIDIGTAADMEVAHARKTEPEPEPVPPKSGFFAPVAKVFKKVARLWGGGN